MQIDHDRETKLAEARRDLGGLIEKLKMRGSLGLAQKDGIDLLLEKHGLAVETEEQKALKEILSQFAALDAADVAVKMFETAGLDIADHLPSGWSIERKQ